MSFKTKEVNILVERLQKKHSNDEDWPMIYEMFGLLDVALQGLAQLERIAHLLECIEANTQNN